MLIGIDVGTSSCKITLFDPDLGTVQSGPRRDLEVLTPVSGHAEMDAVAVFAAVQECLLELGACHPEVCRQARGIGVSAIFPTLVPLSDDGVPLRPAILYHDLRSQAEVERLNREIGLEELEAIIGNRLMPGTSLLPGVCWLQKHEPQLAAKTASYSQLGAYVVSQLTGEHVLDTTQASLSAFCRGGEENQWAEKLLGLAGITRCQLPPIKDAPQVAGFLRPELARACGLPVGLPVATASGDAPLAALGGGICRPGQLFVSVGSTDCLIASGSRPSGNSQFCNVRHLSPSCWLAIGTMSSAGASVQWFCERLLHCSALDLETWAGLSPSGSRGVVFLPYLQGERTPVWDASARGVWHGLGLNCGRNELARSLLEGVACGWRQIVELLAEEFTLPPGNICCAGGGSRNRLWNQIKATMLQRPIQVLPHQDGSGLGAAMAAGMAAGVFANAEEAVAASEKLRSGEVVEPVPEWQDSLEQTYQTYQKLYPAFCNS